MSSLAGPGHARAPFRYPGATSAARSGYFILEKGQTSVCLRVRGTSVQIGVRFKSHWHKIASVTAEMSVAEVEDLRSQAVRLARQLQDEELTPSLSRGRSMTVRMLFEEFMALDPTCTRLRTCPWDGGKSRRGGEYLSTMRSRLAPWLILLTFTAAGAAAAAGYGLTAPKRYRATAVGASLWAVTETVECGSFESAEPSLTFTLITRSVVSGVFELLL